MTYPDLQIDWLRAFVAAVDAGSLSGAAALVHRSQSAVSMQIKKLENALGRAVLLRSPRHMALTPLGSELFGPELAGRVRLGVPDDYASSYLTPVLRSFSSRYQGVEIELTCEQSTSLIPKISLGELDLALVSRDKPQRGRFLFQEPLVWVGAPQYEAWRRNPLPLAVYEEGSMARLATLSSLSAQRRAYRIVYHSASLVGQLAAVESGLAVAVCTRCSVPSGLQILQNLPAEFELPALGPMFVAVLRSKASQRSPAVDALYQQMVKTLANSGHRD